MRILVCFKVTPDYEALPESYWTAGAADGADTRYVRRVINCFDESALEMALRLSDEMGDGGVQLSAVTIGGREADRHLTALHALGYGQADRIQPHTDLDFAPSVTASIIAAYAEAKAQADVLMLGCRSGPADSGAVPFLVAEALGWPCLTQVVEVAPVAGGADDRLRVTCVTDEGLLRLTLRPPCVLAVGNAVVSHLRVPTLKDRLATRDRKIEVLYPEHLGVDAVAGCDCSTTMLTGLQKIDRARPGAVIDGATPRDKARVLADTYLRPLLETP